MAAAIVTLSGTFCDHEVELSPGLVSQPRSTVLVMPRFHPWRRLRDQPHVDLVWSRDLPVMGRTNGRDRIEMHPDQLQVERRCTLAHELAHVELGHAGGCSGAEEEQARQLAARWLIETENLLDALRWTENLEELADELWVDLDTLRARLDGVSDAERGLIEALYDAMERGV